MKIFPKETLKSSKSENAMSTGAKKKAHGPASRKKAELPEKKEISAAQIKEKLAANIETSELAKNKAIVSTKRLGESFLNDEVLKASPVMVKEEILQEKINEVNEKSDSPNTKDYLVKSDIHLNDPKDTNTQEKLKTVLTRGAFNFNPKERETLEKILST